MSLPFLIVGNPENRRVTGFQEALRARGHPAAQVVPWVSFLEDPRALEALPNEPLLIRVESYGESLAVDKLLFARGYDDARKAGVSTLSLPDIRALGEDRGRILAPRQHHLGVERALRQLEGIFLLKDRWIVLNSPGSLRDLFDKRVTSRRYAESGIPVPRALWGVANPGDLRARLASLGITRAYVKLSCGSSASCLGIYQHDDRGESLTTTIEVARPLSGTARRLYNSLKVRRYTATAQIDELLQFLLTEGSQVEESVPKARLGGALFDCRVVVVAGEAAFTVVRQSHHEITNLHLGGWRGELNELEKHAPAAILEAGMESCRRVFQAHACLHVGVDLMFEEGFTGHCVLEANAFGDLLPNLTREGLSVYAWQIRAAETLIRARESY